MALVATSGDMFELLAAPLRMQRGPGGRTETLQGQRAFSTVLWERSACGQLASQAVGSLLFSIHAHRLSSLPFVTYSLEFLFFC